MNINITDLGELIIWIGSVLGALGVIGAFVHFAIVKPMGKALDERIREVTSYLKTHNGKSIGECVENMAQDIAQLRDQMQVTNALALQINSLINETKTEQQRHLREDHNG